MYKILQENLNFNVSFVNIVTISSPYVSQAFQLRSMEDFWLLPPCERFYLEY